jgi:16S rRNA (guanine966-N2)-methyltransferase
MRVIAGRLGGRRLDAPPGQGTRPTSDRVREAIFSILAGVGGARVLDLYAGTGALGIEALSRGAERATFVESAPKAIAVLKRNLTSLGLDDEARVIASRAERAVAPLAESGPYDLVLVDPPYADLDDAITLLTRLTGRGAVAEGGRVVLEHASGDGGREVPGLTLEDERRYGDTGVSIYVAAPR